MIVVECESVPEVAVTVIMLVPAGVPAAPVVLDLPPPQPAAAKRHSRITARPPARTRARKPKRDRSLPKYRPARRKPTNPAASNIRSRCDVGRELDAGPDGTAPAIPLRAVVVMVSIGVVLPPGV